MVINHESIRTSCKHVWINNGPTWSTGGMSMKQAEICRKCGMDAVTTWDDQPGQQRPHIRRRAD